ncbi:MAG TPA: hypothetical protein VMU59_03010 [Caulobacteraceae bacterium]|nr:hypothetical protein [Caulobacteraceae bacterium]
MRALRVTAVTAATAAALATAPLSSARAADPKSDKPESIQIQAVGLPVVVDDRVINYVFVTVKLDLVMGADGATVRAKEPFFRDALLRAGHRTPFTLASDYTKMDVGKIRAEVLRDAATIMGKGVVRDVEVVKQVSQRQGRLKAPTQATAAPTRAREPEIIP